jgi:hypothetical protein
MEGLFMPQKSYRDMIVDHSFHAPLFPMAPASVAGIEFSLIVNEVMV